MYDSFAFVHSSKTQFLHHAYSDVYSLESGLVPVHDYFTLRIKANKPVPPELMNKMLIKRTWKGKSEVVKAKGDGDWFTAQFRSFGNFELIADDEPPVINASFHDNANLSKASYIIFTPKDNNEDNKKFQGRT